MTITYAKVGEPIVDDALGEFADGWRHSHVVDPQTGAPPTDGAGREMEWTEIDLRQGYGYIFDLDATDGRMLRIEAPWIRLLRLELRLPPTPDDFFVPF